MDDQHSESPSIESSPVPYKDRSTGLIIFGILTILLGALAGLMVLLMLLGQAMTPRTENGQPPFSQILFVVALYGALAIALIWLGIGSIMARRWARALLLIFSWSWLIMGIFVLILMAILMPRVLSQANVVSSNGTTSHEVPIGPVMFFMFLFLGFFFIVLPAIWVFFYNSRHVKATCETRDPVTRWTDARPLPVLAICLWAFFSGLTILLMPVSGHFVAVFFGTFLTGFPGTIFYLAVAGLQLYAAWLLYKLDQRGWWLILILMCLMAISSLLTFIRHDSLEMYKLMNYPPAQIEQMQKTGLLQGNSFMWIMSCAFLPFIGYLLFIKKYFPRQS